MSAYSDLLRDPRWQKRRLHVFERDNWTCIYCGNKDKELQVHHMLYLSDRNPWEYDDDNLVTACIDCHADETQLKSDDKTLVNMLSMAGISRRRMYSLATELRRFVRSDKAPHLQFQRLMDFLYANG